MSTSEPTYQSKHPPFAVTVDLVVLALRPVESADRAGRLGLDVVLIERGEAPHLGALALPGGFVHVDEDLEAAAYRELEEETGLRPSDVRLAQLGAYGSPGRDPRMRTVSVAWLAFGRVDRTPHAGSDARAAHWLPADRLPADLAFDHAKILHDAVAQARTQVQDVRVAASFLPPVFTLSQLRRVYEAVWGLELDAPNFQRRILALTGGAAGDQRPLLRTEADGIVDTTTSRRSKHVLKLNPRAHDLPTQSCRFDLPR
ncbi:NUDIX hydrolase [Zhihengliuella salsuginis]|uniref:NUDIX hydrolase n=1 Tax=Zhihengliuella salsuginis TaxID=578222 RepID=A0ABQ3GJ76_9MICC|nr:NUDIX hydrolase [Zhihengliuella salsuginis]GHD06223.1 NUDIX hydrolase [Zhihengliuella salsuginis]